MGYSDLGRARGRGARRRGLAIAGALPALAALAAALAVPASAMALAPSAYVQPGSEGSRLAASSARRTRAAPRAAAATGAVPDPYELVADDIAQMKQSLREVAKLNAGSNPTGVAASQPVLTMAVQEFLKRPGKSFRPMIVLLLGRVAETTAVRAKLPTTRLTGDALKAKHMRLAELTEMMNVASIIHDDVMDDVVPDAGAAVSVSGVGGNIVHKMYSPNVGNKVSILAGDFLLARAAVELAQLEDPAVVEIMAGALESIVRGGVLRAESLNDDMLNVDAYCARTKARSAQLLANACRCAALLAGFDFDSAEANAAEAYGCHLGMAHAIAADLRDFNASVLNAEPASAQLIGAPSAVSLFAAERRPSVLDVVKRQSSSPADIARLVAAVRETSAEQATQELGKIYLKCVVMIV